MKDENKHTGIFILIFIIASIIGVLNRTGPLAGELRYLGFSVFTILCIVIAVIVRKSLWKVSLIAAYWLLFGVTVIV
ncbi:hypothetical protein ACTSEZ_07510 [Metabacillus sp. JX24]|uniref:hypothetical protein n=1 Tax=Metabacillus sp. JX24 TaxID=3240759 RepID=UPI00351026ED